jgi:hypothetical protein
MRVSARGREDARWWLCPWRGRRLPRHTTARPPCSSPSSSGAPTGIRPLRSTAPSISLSLCALSPLCRTQRRLSTANGTQVRHPASVHAQRRQNVAQTVLTWFLESRIMVHPSYARQRSVHAPSDAPQACSLLLYPLPRCVRWRFSTSFNGALPHFSFAPNGALLLCVTVLSRCPRRCTPSLSQRRSSVELNTFSRCAERCSSPRPTALLCGSYIVSNGVRYLSKACDVLASLFMVART